MSQAKLKFVDCFACPEIDCKFKSRKFSSIGDVNKHLKITHDSEWKVRLADSNRAYLVHR